eukprot:scaffold66483_cov23-Tisochrysis_lutea.AAC.2
MPVPPQASLPLPSLMPLSPNHHHHHCPTSPALANRNLLMCAHAVLNHRCCGVGESSSHDASCHGSLGCHSIPPYLSQSLKARVQLAPRNSGVGLRDDPYLTKAHMKCGTCPTWLPL